MRTLSFAEAIDDSVLQAMTPDDRIVILGGMSTPFGVISIPSLGPTESGQHQLAKPAL